MMTIVDGIEALLESKDLSPRELRDLAKANVYVMDMEVNGIALPKEIEKLGRLRRRLTTAENRVILNYFYQNAPGNYS